MPTLSPAPATTAPRVPERALAGLSPVSAARLVANSASERSATGAIVYASPGAWAHTWRLSRDHLLALPPPRKALFPVSALEETVRYVRGSLAGLLFVALAGYLALKDATGSPGARARLEARAPTVAAALARAGLIEDVASTAIPLDRRLLGRRVWLRFSAGLARMPRERAVRVIAVACQAARGEWAGAENPPSSASTAAADAALGIGVEAAQVSMDAFISAFVAAVKDESDILLFLGVAHALEVRAAATSTLSRLGDLYDAVVRARGKTTRGGGAGIDFSPQTLAALAADVGFAADEGHAARFLLGCAGAFEVGGGRAGGGVGGDTAARRTLAAVAEGAAENPKSGTANGAAARGAVSAAGARAVPISRDEFIDYMVLAAAAVGVVTPERVEEYVRLYEMLQPARAAAGVAIN